MKRTGCGLRGTRCAMHAVAAIALALMVTGGVAAADGAYDTTWAGNGRLSFAADLHDTSRSSQATQIEVQADGTLLLGGDLPSGIDYNNYWWLGELTPGGAPVTTFGSGDGSGRRYVRCRRHFAPRGDLWRGLRGRTTAASAFPRVRVLYSSLQTDKRSTRAAAQASTCSRFRSTTPKARLCRQTRLRRPPGESFLRSAPATTTPLGTVTAISPLRG